MYVKFYKVTDQARQDYSEICPISVAKTQKQTETEEEYVQEINRKIRKCTNLGQVIETKNGFEVRQYFDLLFVVKDYVIQYVYKSEGLEPFEVSRKDKDKYDYIEEKLTTKNTEC